MFNSISSNMTKWLGGTEPDDSPEVEQTESAQSPSPPPEEKKSNETSEQPQKVDSTNEESPQNEDESKPDSPQGTEAALQDQLDEVGKQAAHAAKEWGTWLYGMGKTATKEFVKTAKVVKDTMEEKTILGDFSKEQDKFVTENTEKKKKSEVAVAPWIGYNEEEDMKKQILALSKDQRNFLRSPPVGVQFQFDYTNMYPVAMAVLQEDPNLSEMRFKLVPKNVKEEAFWRNYFYRVSLIKQSAQLTAMAQSTGNTGEADLSKPTEPVRDSSNQDGVPTNQRVSETEGDVAGSPPENEFISDTFQDSHYDEEALKKEMQQLGVDDKEKADAGEYKEYLHLTPDQQLIEDEDVPEWERELQAELQEYEVVADDMADQDDADLEQEILQQLQDEQKTT